MNIWRIHIRPSGGRENHKRAFKFCLESNVIGMGWRVNLDNNEVITNYKEYWSDGEAIYGTPSWRSNVGRFINDVSIGDLIWTRNSQGVYYLGRIEGNWEYRESDASIHADILNIRKTNLFEVGLESKVPGKVISAFRAGRTLQKIHGNTTAIYSKYLFNELKKQQIYSLDKKGLDIFKLLSADDVENVVYVYLQTKGYVAYPSGRKADTMSYEFILKDRKTYNEAVVQVKTGHTSVDLSMLPDNSEIKIYAFATSGSYLNRESRNNVTLLGLDEIKKFMKDNRLLLPASIQNWMEIAGM